MSLYQKFLQASQIPSDINEHVKTLFEYAAKCESVAEFGVRGGVSTFGLLYGLTQNNSESKKYIGVDINYCEISQTMSSECKSANIDYQFIQHDSATVDLPEVDLLFIDSWHIYGHLKRELENNHSRVKKYILMHDTTIDGDLGESIRCNWNTFEQSKSSGYPEEEIRKGLWPAVTEFLEQHKDWKLLERYTNNNGLTILQRV